MLTPIPRLKKRRHSMAFRGLLHKNSLNSFRDFLHEKGYVQVAHNTQSFEVLKMRNPGLSGPKRTVVVYTKAEAPQHVSVQEKDMALLQDFFVAVAGRRFRCACIADRRTKIFKRITHEWLCCGDPGHVRQVLDELGITRQELAQLLED
jgi:hypothetical protein